MRTKRTGQGSVAEANGAASATPRHMQQAAPADTRSLAQPTELSETDRDMMKMFLDRAEKPFSVVTNPARKRKRDGKIYPTQEDLWEDRLAVQYEVKPRDKWESLRRYKKFTGVFS